MEGNEVTVDYHLMPQHSNETTMSWLNCENENGRIPKITLIRNMGGKTKRPPKKKMGACCRYRCERDAGSYRAIELSGRVRCRGGSVRPDSYAGL